MFNRYGFGYEADSDSVITKRLAALRVVSIVEDVIVIEAEFQVVSNDHSVLECLLVYQMILALKC